MVKVDVRLDEGAIKAQLDSLKKDIADRVIPTALNKTAITVRKTGAQEISIALGKALGINEIRKAIQIVKARKDNPVVIIRPSGRKRIPLGAFIAVKQTKTGVTARVGKRTYNIPHAFIVVMNGRPRVFIRAASFKGQMAADPAFRSRRVQKSGHDLPIAEIFVPGVPFAFVDQKIRDAMVRVGRERFPVVAAQEIAFRTSRG